MISQGVTVRGGPLLRQGRLLDPVGHEAKRQEVIGRGQRSAESPQMKVHHETLRLTGVEQRGDATCREDPNTRSGGCASLIGSCSRWQL